MSTALRFPSGERCELVGLPSRSSGRTTLADGSAGAVLQPGLAEPLPPAPAGLSRVPESRLRYLARELGSLLDREAGTDSGESWFGWAATVERQAVAELARRVL